MLKIRDVWVRRGGKAVVCGIDMDIRPGEITALLGANGAGKSSTVLAIGGAIPIVKGRVELDDVPLHGLRAEAVRAAGVAIVPEGHHVLGGLSVRDNLLASATLLRASEVAGAMQRVLALFPDLGACMDTPARALSGGQKQMVCIAQAMITSPRVLVIDELSLGLAPLIVKRLAGVIEQVARDGVGVLLIEQFTSLALSISNHACLLERGRVAFSGSAVELRERPEILHGSYLAAR